MKRIVFSLLLVLLLTACAPTHTDDGLLILRVDEEHNGGHTPYEMDAASGFALELHGYKFEVPEYIPTVNMIMITLGPDQTYSVPVNPDEESLYRLTAETLNPEEKSKPFSGLKAGDLATVGVGYWEDGKGFFVVWFGRVSIK